MEVFVAYADVPERRAALTAPPGSLERYRLFGLDEGVARGVGVRHNLERGALPVWAKLGDRVARRLVDMVGGYGGDFASILASLRAADRSDVIFSTVDRVGIPLVLREWLGPGGPPVVFVPFGVDIDGFREDANAQPDVDVVSVGADPHRDFELLVGLARRHPELSFHVVASRALGELPPNVAFESGLSLEQVRDRLAAARVVALPVKPNSYSGATTVLLQAMALARPVVVSRTEAIAAGYGLEDRTNCRLVEPGDPEAFEQALLETLADPGTLGARARETVERGFSWERYTSALWDILAGACESQP